VQGPQGGDVRNAEEEEEEEKGGPVLKLPVLCTWTHTCRRSVGSPNRRVSQNSIWPSVDTEAHRELVLEEIQNTSYTGSWCEFSITLSSAGEWMLEEDFRRSKKDTMPL
jgi:hypothetical protein